MSVWLGIAPVATRLESRANLVWLVNSAIISNVATGGTPVAPLAVSFFTHTSPSLPLYRHRNRVSPTEAERRNPPMHVTPDHFVD